MLFSPQKSILLVIDIQGRLARLMYDKDQYLANVQKLISAANILDIPIIYTEQAPEKIGPTIPEIKQLLDHCKLITKQRMSCCGEPNFLKTLNDINRRQIIIAGVEAHVCIFQTAHDLFNQGFLVQVVSDAISARSADNKQIALERMRMEGVTITNTEMMLCELIRGADHPKFKEILNIFK